MPRARAAPVPLDLLLRPERGQWADDHYREPVLYDLEYSGWREDVPFYEDLATGVHELLELGAGTGRLTLPMARRGARVVALELARPMSGLLRTRADAEGLPIEVVDGDFRRFDLGRTFPLVVLPFNAVHHLYAASEVLDLMASVRRHLAPGGRFVLDAMLADPRVWPDDPTGRYEPCTFPDPDGGTIESWESSWYDPLTQVLHVEYHYVRANGRHQKVEVPLRIYYPQELLGLVRLAGWSAAACWGDFDRSPVTSDSRKLVLTLEPKS